MSGLFSKPKTPPPPPPPEPAPGSADEDPATKAERRRKRVEAMREAGRHGRQQFIVAGRKEMAAGQARRALARRGAVAAEMGAG